MVLGLEQITIPEALLLSVVAMLIIMSVLACIMGLIYAMRYAFVGLDALKAKMLAKKATTVEAVEEDVALAPGSCGEVATFGIPDREVAMIMAIVADQLNTPLNELRFTSIKEIDDAKGE
jgi:hypothetical protein